MHYQSTTLFHCGFTRRPQPISQEEEARILAELDAVVSDYTELAGLVEEFWPDSCTHYDVPTPVFGSSFDDTRSIMPTQHYTSPVSQSDLPTQHYTSPIAQSDLPTINYMIPTYEYPLTVSVAECGGDSPAFPFPPSITEVTEESEDDRHQEHGQTEYTTFWSDVCSSSTDEDWAYLDAPF